MEKYLHSFRWLENVYYLNRAGRERIGSKNVRNKAMDVDHTIMRNDIYIHYKFPKVWEIEKKLTDEIIIDAVFQDDKGMFHFLECDNTRKMLKNKEKIEKYKEFLDTGDFQRRYNHTPLIIYYTRSENRKQKLQQMLRGTNSQVYTKKDLIM